MWVPFGNYEFLARLRAFESPQETHRRAQVIATARVFLAIVSLLAIYLDPTEPARYAALAYGLMIFYALFSVLALAVLRRWENPATLSRAVVHAVDLAWASCIILFTEGPNSPFFLFYTFVLLAAAYRWSSRETILSALSAFLLLWLEAGILRRQAGWLEGDFELNRLIMRTTYILIMGALMGYLADEDKLIRGESAFVSRTLARIQGQAGLFAGLSSTLDAFSSLYGARVALLVSVERETGRTFVWERTWAADGARLPLRMEELGTAVGEALAGPDLHKCMYLTIDAKRKFRGKGWAADGRRADLAPFDLPWLGPFEKTKSLVWVDVPFSDEWQGRLLLLDPEVRPQENQSRFLLSAAQQIAPAVHSLYLIRRLRARAGALERARVARELHDGVIQSLLSLELQVSVLHQQADCAPALAAELQAIQQQIHQQVLEVRDLMEQMRPAAQDPRLLLESMAGLADRFGRDSGIATSFVSTLQDVELRPGAGRELLQVLREALVNVRKHSGATQLVIRFSAHAGDWILEVDDNGRGFNFAGSLSLQELAAKRLGPLVIRERVQALAGDLQVESNPGKGARLRISIPQTRHGE